MLECVFHLYFYSASLVTNVRMYIRALFLRNIKITVCCRNRGAWMCCDSVDCHGYCQCWLVGWLVGWLEVKYASGGCWVWWLGESGHNRGERRASSDSCGWIVATFRSASCSLFACHLHFCFYSLLFSNVYIPGSFYAQRLAHNSSVSCCHYLPMNVLMVRSRSFVVRFRCGAPHGRLCFGNRSPYFLTVFIFRLRLRLVRQFGKFTKKFSFSVFLRLFRAVPQAAGWRKVCAVQCAKKKKWNIVKIKYV